MSFEVVLSQIFGALGGAHPGHFFRHPIPRASHSDGKIT